MDVTSGEVLGGAGGGDRQAGDVGAVEERHAARIRAACVQAMAGSVAGPVGGTLRRKLHDRATWDLAKADFVARVPINEIAARYGMTRHAIHGRAAREGWAALRAPVQRLPPRGRREPGAAPVRLGVKAPVFVTPEQRAEAVAMYRAGATAQEVADTFNVSAQTVYSWVTRSGVRGAGKRESGRTAARVALIHARRDGLIAAQRSDEAGWETLARAAQRAPEGAWSTWLFQGGRGAGKTRAGAEWLAALAQATPDGRFALVGATQADVREVMVDGASGIRNLPARERPRYEGGRRRLVWGNGAMAYAYSAEEPERMRGPQFMAAWADEYCTWPKPEETLSILRMALRLGEDPRLVVTTTPKPMASLRLLRAEPGCVVTHAASADNAQNLPRGFLGGLEALYGGTRRAAQELEGLLLADEGALWRAEEIARSRGVAPDVMERVVVGVDPPASLSGTCGIVAAGRVGRRGYVLSDWSVAAASPLGWALRVAEAARAVKAQAIIAECNQGGDMVRSVLASAGSPCRIELVRASVGKRARAEPVAALYEQGRVTHCGVFAQLEEELMALGGEEETRLDRADALVWALSELLVKEPPVMPRISLA